MAKNDDKTVRLRHTNGGTVIVSQDKADRLVAGGNFAAVKTATKAAGTTTKSTSDN